MNGFRAQLQAASEQITAQIAPQLGEVLTYNHRGTRDQTVYGFPESGGNASMQVILHTRTQEDLRTFQIETQSTNAADFTPSAGSWLLGIATLTIGAHTYLVGDTAFITGTDPIGYDGTYVLTAVTGTTISYALAVNPGAFVAGGNANLSMPFPPNTDDMLSDDTILDEDGNLYVIGKWSADALKSVYTFTDCVYRETRQVGVVGQ